MSPSNNDWALCVIQSGGPFHIWPIRSKLLRKRLPCILNMSGRSTIFQGAEECGLGSSATPHSRARRGAVVPFGGIGNGRQSAGKGGKSAEMRLLQANPRSLSKEKGRCLLLGSGLRYREYECHDQPAQHEDYPLPIAVCGAAKPYTT